MDYGKRRRLLCRYSQHHEVRQKAFCNRRRKADQIGISTASMLSLMLFQFNLIERVPKISYFTPVDQYGVGFIVLVFLAVMGAVLISTVAGLGKGEPSRRIERWARVAFPALFLRIFAVAFFV